MDDEMEGLGWDSPRSSDGMAQLVGRGRVALAAIMSLIALMAYVGVAQPRANARSVSQPRQAGTQALGLGGAGQTNDWRPPTRVSSVAAARRSAISSELWADTVARFPTLLHGEGLTKVREVASTLSQHHSSFVRNPLRFQVDVVESPISDEFAFTDGRLLLTSGLVQRLRSPGQIAAVLSQMMERVIVAQNPSVPYSRIAVALLTRAGFDPRALAWLIDERSRNVAPHGPRAAERLAALRQQSDRVAAEITAVFPSGVPETLVK